MKALIFYMMTPRPSHFFSLIEKHFIVNVLKNELQAKRQCTVSHCYVRCPQEKPGEAEDCSYLGEARYNARLKLGS